MTCQTFTHHVEGEIVVECAQHPEFVVVVPAQPPKPAPQAREVATAWQRVHEDEYR